MDYNKIQKKYLPIAAVTGSVLIYCASKMGQITATRAKALVFIFIGCGLLNAFVLSIITGESVSKGLIIYRKSTPILFYISVCIDLFFAIALFLLAVN